MSQLRGGHEQGVIFELPDKEVLNMPGLNGTGPMGQGPGTGKGLGRCRSKMRADAAGEAATPEKPALTTLSQDGQRLRLRGGRGTGRCRGRGQGRRPRCFER
ncbi:DUF5320 domain-containing protein [Desulfonatronospira sp.]|uniref:DUF5320 domain-containing protein n=1 Tax=Desulfonatronospira sp. TaxID=1962951 RepID=UPI00343E714B